MIAAVILVVLLVAFTLLRMWDAARDVAWEEPPAPGAGSPADAPTSPADAPTPPARAGVRAAAILVSLVLGFVSYVGLPLLADALLDDGGDSPDRTWTVCDGTHLIVFSGRDGTSAVQLTDQKCE